LRRSIVSIQIPRASPGLSVTDTRLPLFLSPLPLSPDGFRFPKPHPVRIQISRTGEGEQGAPNDDSSHDCCNYAPFQIVDRCARPNEDDKNCSISRSRSPRTSLNSAVFIWNARMTAVAETKTEVYQNGKERRV
jgi:hypothetical protein